MIRYIFHAQPKQALEGVMLHPYHSPLRESTWYLRVTFIECHPLFYSVHKQSGWRLAPEELIGYNRYNRIFSMPWLPAKWYAVVCLGVSVFIGSDAAVESRLPSQESLHCLASFQRKETWTMSRGGNLGEGSICFWGNYLVQSNHGLRHVSNKRQSGAIVCPGLSNPSWMAAGSPIVP